MTEKKLFYHPESDSYLEVPEHEIGEMLNSADGANCTEIRDLMVPIPPTQHHQYTVVAKEELVTTVAQREAQMGDAPAIVDQTTFNAVRAVVKDAKQTHTTINAARELAKTPFLEACRRIDAAAKPLLDRLTLVMAEGKQQQADYIVERDRKLAEEDAARVLSEAAAKLDTSRPTAPLTPVRLAEPLQAPLQSRRWVEIVDASLIPREYLVPDLARITFDALAGKAIPGAQVVDGNTLAAR